MEKQIIENKVHNKEPEGSKKVKPVSTVEFPRNSLLEALKVPQTIWDQGAGLPLQLIDIAKKLNNSPTSSTFRSLIRSSQRYGLTNGTFTQDLSRTISLTTLGQSIVAPTPNDDVNALKRNALETPSLFQNVLESLNAKILPQEDIFKNMLIRDYKLNKDDAEAGYLVLMKNLKELSLIDDFQGKTYIRLDRLSSETVRPQGPSYVKEEQVPAAIEKDAKPVIPGIPAEGSLEIKKPKVFISHSKNKKILDQIKQMLEFGNFDFVIAEEKETTAVPLSDKVFGLMWNCNCAIINISADEEKKSENSFSINENVLAELWGSYLHYMKRVILVIDRRLKDKLPSIMQGLTAIFYEGDELSWSDGMRLQKSLSEFRSQL